MTTAIAETPAVARLEGGPLAYTLRRSPRSRTLRVVIHPERGVVVSIPPATRRGWARPDERIEAFLRDREPWVRRHLARQAQARAVLAARGGIRDGAQLRYRGELHRLRIVATANGERRSTVIREGGADEDELLVRISPRDRRTTVRVLDGWLRERARAAIERDIERHAPGIGVRPSAVTIRDPRSRWGSASGKGRLSFSWRLVLAPPEALETVVIHELAHLVVLGHGPAFWDIVARHRPDHARWRRWLRDHSVELHGALDG